MLFVKNIAVIFLLFVIAGGVSFCLFSENIPMGHDAHDASSNHELMAHLLHAVRPALIAIGTAFLALMATLLAVIALGSLSEQQKTLSFEGRERQDFFSAVEKKISCWLSIFERSPNVIQTT